MWWVLLCHQIYHMIGYFPKYLLFKRNISLHKLTNMYHHTISSIRPPMMELLMSNLSRKGKKKTVLQSTLDTPKSYEIQYDNTKLHSPTHN